jgi:hypothetical protein
VRNNSKLIPFLAFALIIPGIAFASEGDSLVKECEKIFPDLEVLGKVKFEQRYLHHKDLRSCYVMYNDLIWYSDGPDRTQRLLELLKKPQQDTQVRDRFVQSNAVPQWIKDDAMRWHQGKEKDNIFSYGIRYMINSKMINLPISAFDPQSCGHDTFCVSKNDYIKYSIKDSKIDDTTTQTHTIGVGSSSIAVSTVEVSKDGKKTDAFQVKNDGLIANTQKYYRFIHKIPIQIGSTIKSAFDIKVTDEILFPFKNTKRQALLAWDETKQYHEVIDKQTGVVLFAKHENRILKSIWTAELTDTNVFTKEIKIQYKDMQIPPWFRATVKLWTENKITDTEYLNGINYLLKNKIMKI